MRSKMIVLTESWSVQSLQQEKVGWISSGRVLLVIEMKLVRSESERGGRVRSE